MSFNDKLMRDHPGLNLVGIERMRQIRGEGFTIEKDQRHLAGELVQASFCYTAQAVNPKWNPNWNDFTSMYWPWDREWWKPTTPHGNLVKAGALIVAELDRRIYLDRYERGISS